MDVPAYSLGGLTVLCNLLLFEDGLLYYESFWLFAVLICKTGDVVIVSNHHYGFFDGCDRCGALLRRLRQIVSAYWVFWRRELLWRFIKKEKAF